MKVNVGNSILKGIVCVKVGRLIFKKLLGMNGWEGLVLGWFFSVFCF